MLSRLFTIHRSWEDWLGMVLGLAIALSPWATGDAVGPRAVWNAALVGVLVFFLAELEYVALRRWEETGQILLGLWLVLSPYIFGYANAGALRFWHSTLGGLVILLAALELWQDWQRSNDEMLRRSRLFGR